MTEKANPGCRKCRTCKYHGSLSASHKILCEYILITGHMRGGLPEDCTKYKPIRSRRQNKSIVLKGSNRPKPLIGKDEAGEEKQ